MNETAGTANHSSTTVTNSPANSKSSSARFRRWRRILILLFVIFAAFLFFKHYWLEHPVGSGPAGPEVSRQPFAAEWSQREVLLVGLGDSVTDGYGATPGAKSYFNRLVKNPEDEWPQMEGVCLSSVLPNLQALNLSRSGTTSIENLEYLVPDLEVQSSDTYGIVVMTTGGNDIIHSYGQRPPKEGAMYGATFDQAKPWIANFETRLVTTIAAITKQFPGGCDIFLANIYDPTDGVGNAMTMGLPRWPDAIRIHNTYNDVISKTCSNIDNVHLVDMRKEFLGHGIYSRQFWNQHYRKNDPNYWYWDNFEDPNNRGYDAIRRLFLNKITAVCKPKLVGSHVSISN